MNFLKESYKDFINLLFGELAEPRTGSLDECSPCQLQCNLQCECRCHYRSCRRCDRLLCDLKSCRCFCHKEPEEGASVEISPVEGVTAEPAGNDFLIAGKVAKTRADLNRNKLKFQKFQNKNIRTSNSATKSKHQIKIEKQSKAANPRESRPSYIKFSKRPSDRGSSLKSATSLTGKSKTDGLFAIKRHIQKSSMKSLERRPNAQKDEQDNSITPFKLGNAVVPMISSVTGDHNKPYLKNSFDLNNTQVHKSLSPELEKLAEVNRRMHRQKLISNSKRSIMSQDLDKVSCWESYTGSLLGDINIEMDDEQSGNLLTGGLETQIVKRALGPRESKNRR